MKEMLEDEEVKNRHFGLILERRGKMKKNVNEWLYKRKKF